MARAIGIDRAGGAVRNMTKARILWRIRAFVVQ
ncbi:hypothetical protein STRAU_3535 [Streptomyces aurantiacus JA 4570]|uniref:Uncharacterized protein n=1 Tax=Streptomyces aurantiacus JA 4570 TaxID=1286094 RepID=S3ZJM8_9ACTN|nr:hypothetical protein STRAU_3535 [Streptomyces aurantiacus JA 4570]